MTCKDCVHCEVCDYWYKEAYPHDHEKSDCGICRYFKNKNTCIEVPCIIGQTMWRLCTWYRSPAEIVESRVSMIQQKADKSWKFRISNKYGTDDFKADEIGKYVFLTKEAAEEALNKLNKEADQ